MGPAVPGGSSEGPRAEDRAPQPPPLLHRWLAFIHERFPLATHLLMVAAFFVGNAAVAAASTGVERSWPVRLFASLATLLVFFRLRLFDELKDLHTDRRAHPDRPLPRGLVSPGEARGVALGAACLEAGLAALCGPSALAAWALLSAFSLLMYREFFVGPWLRPRMELYALSHTLVAAFLGLFVTSAVTGLAFRALPAAVWLFALANWSVFNVFEFARKTRAPDEEDPRSESYSQRLRPAGAALLTLVWLATAAGVAFRAAALPLALFGVAAGVLLFLPGLVACAYAVRPTRATARLFRGAMGAFIIVFYFTTAAARRAGALLP
jgi:4-hydroxybenzoate polyprenyltransferase